MAAGPGWTIAELRLDAVEQASRAQMWADVADQLHEAFITALEHPYSGRRWICACRALIAYQTARSIERTAP